MSFPNHYLVPLRMTAATASATGDDMDNLTRVGAHIIINITTISGTTPTATFTVEGKDQISGTYYTLLASSALNATGQTVLRIMPTGTASANAVANDMMPQVWRVRCTTGGTVTNLTCTVGANLMGG